jgi:hypothetical protein
MRYHLHMRYYLSLSEPCLVGGLSCMGSNHTGSVFNDRNTFSGSKCSCKRTGDVRTSITYIVTFDSV